MDAAHQVIHGGSSKDWAKHIISSPHRASAASDRLYIICGPLSILLLMLFLPATRSLPPISPGLTGEDLVDRYRENETAWKVSIIFAMLSTIFWPLYGIGLSSQLSRIPGVPPSILSTIVAAGNCIALTFLMTAIFYASTIYRLDRDPALTQILSDTAWLYFNMTPPIFVVQDIAIVAALRCDTRPKPLLPAWLAWTNSLLPVGMFGTLGMHFVHGGAFGWAGAVAFWLTCVSFFTQFCLNVVCFWIAAGTCDEDLE